MFLHSSVDLGRQSPVEVADEDLEDRTCSFSRPVSAVTINLGGGKSLVNMMRGKRDLAKGAKGTSLWGEKTCLRWQ